MFVDINLIVSKPRAELARGDLVLDASRGVLLVLGDVDQRKAVFNLASVRVAFAPSSLSCAHDDVFDVLPAECSELRFVLTGRPISADEHYDLTQKPQPLIRGRNGWIAVLQRRPEAGTYAGSYVSSGEFDEAPAWQGQLYPSWQIELRRVGSPALICSWSWENGLQWGSRDSSRVD